MSFQDFVTAVDNSSPLGTKAPVLGEASSAGGWAKKMETVQVKYIVCYMSDTQHKEEAERILTQSLRCENALRKAGDICVFKEESHFDREGEYCVALKYAEVVGIQKKPAGDPMEALVDVP